VEQPSAAGDVITVANNLPATFGDRTVYSIKGFRLAMTYFPFSASVLCFIVTVYVHSVSTLEVIQYVRHYINCHLY